MAILRLLDLSTGHLKQSDAQLLSRNALLIEDAPTRIISHDYGWFVNIVEESIDELNERMNDFTKLSYSDEFIVIYKHAVMHNCSWINFDQDGELLDNLAQFNW